jgi:hypothetical protein
MNKLMLPTPRPQLLLVAAALVALLAGTAAIIVAALQLRTVLG